MKIGDYVLATKWDDGDPGDAWAIGFWDGYRNGRHHVIDNEGRPIRHGGFRKVGCITSETGTWLLDVAAKTLEASPPGTVNLWRMLTPIARYGREGL